MRRRDCNLPLSSKYLLIFVYFIYFEFTRAFLHFYQQSSQDTKQIVTRSATRARFYNRRFNMGLFSGHHFYILVMFLKYALDLYFLVNVDMLCTDLLVTTRLVYKIYKRNSIVLSRLCLEAVDI